MVFGVPDDGDPTREENARTEPVINPIINSPGPMTTSGLDAPLTCGKAWSRYEWGLITSLEGRGRRHRLGVVTLFRLLRFPFLVSGGDPWRPAASVATGTRRARGRHQPLETACLLRVGGGSPSPRSI
jgi:hypothetical protein